MATLTENQGAGAFIVSEAAGSMSRETATLLSGQNAKAGDVLGRVTLGAATAAAVAGNTGNGAFGSVTVGATAKPGVYRLTCIEPASNAGKFQVEDPDGIVVGVATVAVEFVGGGLTFTIADGATDFVSGDSFTVTVAAGSGKYKVVDKDATDGSKAAVALLYADTDASAADKEIVIVARLAEVNGDEIQFGDLDAGQITTAKTELAARNIIVREAI
jgi:hypothetical protein